MQLTELTPAQDSKIERCVLNRMADKDFRKGQDPKQRKSSAFAICTASITGQRKEILHDVSLSYNVEITEARKDENDDFIVSGVAIHETISRNKVKYEANELEKSAPSLKGKPLLKDHNNSVDSIIGRVSESWFDAEEKAVKFKAKVMDKEVQEKISDGRIANVSVGATAKELIKEAKDNVDYVIARGIEFLELSVVAVQGVLGATISHGESYATAILEHFNAGDELLGSPQDSGFQPSQTNRSSLALELFKVKSELAKYQNKELANEVLMEVKTKIKHGGK